MWRIPYMKRLIQPALFAILPFGLLLLPPSATPQAGTTLPIVEKNSQQGYTEKINDKVSFDMVPIPGGSYLMGSPDDEKGRGDNEGPQRPVTVKAFWMAKCEISWDE